MKRLPVLYILLFIFFGLPIILWAVGSQNMELRSRADEGSTPTVTPSATPTLSITPTPSSSPTPTPTITPLPTNSPPRCNGLSVSPGAGAKPLTVTLSCAGYDPNNDITGAEFTFDRDKKQLVERWGVQFGTITTTHTYTDAGTYTVKCRLRDNNMAFSETPDHCTYRVVVSENSLTPTPHRTPRPTPTDIKPLIYTGGVPTATPTLVTTPTVIAPSPASTQGWWSNEKIAQLAMMVIVSGVTIVIALLLHGFFDKR